MRSFLLFFDFCLIASCARSATHRRTSLASAQRRPRTTSSASTTPRRCVLPFSSCLSTVASPDALELRPQPCVLIGHPDCTRQGHQSRVRPQGGAPGARQAQGSRHPRGRCHCWRWADTARGGGAFEIDAVLLFQSILLSSNNPSKTYVAIFDAAPDVGAAFRKERGGNMIQ